MITDEKLREVENALPSLLIVEPWVLNTDKVALKVNDITLATVLPEIALHPEDLPWLEYVIPANRSSGLSYLAYSLKASSMYVVYRGTDILLYEYPEVAFEDFAAVLDSPSLGSALHSLVQGKPFNKMHSATELLVKLSGSVYGIIKG